jgi:xylan 1,4-beta-xylosidase
MVDLMRLHPFAACLLLFALADPAKPRISSAAGSPPSRPVTVQVHAAQTTGPYTPIWNFFGADEPNYIYAPNGKKLLRELSALSPVPVYFRAHNLFTTGNGEASLKWGSTNVYTERPDGTPVYNFAITDRIFDSLVAAHVRPLVEIGFMPEALSTHPQPYRHTFPEGSIFTGWSYPPRDETKWSNLVTAYATHLRHRYGAQTADWLWEVWNEPDIPYWHGTPDQYDRLYDLTAAAIRRALPRARIGGPEATGISDHSEPFLRQFLEHCAHGRDAATGGIGAPLDFISYHPKGMSKFIDGHDVMNLGAQLRAADRGMRIVSGFPEWRNTPIILGEFDPEGCAACTGPQEAWRNGPLYGATVADSIMRVYELARHNNVNVKGVVTWAFEFENQPAFAGLRSLSTDGIPKPVLNVFRLLGMLGAGKSGARWLAVSSDGAVPLDAILANSVRAEPDIDAVATSNHGEIDVLLWNYHDVDAAAPPAQVNLTVDGLTGAAILESEFRVDATHSNAYRVWLQIGSPAQPSEAQQRELERAAALNESPAARPLSIQDGKLNVALTMPRQGVILIRLRRL